VRFGVRPELQRPLHPFLLVTRGAEFLGEYELIDRDDEGDTGDDRGDHCLKERLDGVAATDRALDGTGPELSDTD